MTGPSSRPGRQRAVDAERLRPVPALLRVPATDSTTGRRLGQRDQAPDPSSTRSFGYRRSRKSTGRAGSRPSRPPMTVTQRTSSKTPTNHAAGMRTAKRIATVAIPSLTSLMRAHRPCRAGHCGCRRPWGTVQRKIDPLSGHRHSWSSPGRSWVRLLLSIPKEVPHGSNQREADHVRRGPVADVARGERSMGRPGPSVLVHPGRKRIGRRSPSEGPSGPVQFRSRSATDVSPYPLRPERCGMRMSPPPLGRPSTHT